MKETLEFLKKCGTYFLATDDDGQPRVRPFGTAHEYKDRLYVQTGKNKEVFRQIEKNPKVEISAFDGAKWLRLSGKLVLDDDREARKSMLDAYPNLRAMYDEDDGNTAVLFITEATATFYSFTEAPKTVKF